MKYKKIILIIITILIVAAEVYKYKFAKSPQEIYLSTQTSSDDQVTVNVKPTSLSKNASTWDFEITLDTHSGSLDKDLVEIATLSDEKGNQRTPTSWQGDPSGGHHRKGILSFPSVSSKSKVVTLKIRDLGETSERIFSWEIQ